MSLVEGINKGDNPTFKWGKKRRTGGIKKETQFYESFTFDEIEYFLYDCVYLYKDDEPEPYIGKLIKIWEQPNRRKKVKVLWFFRPVELHNYLRDNVLLEKELFLASGEGVGLANVNPLEAIAGKCNVICISKDDRNPQPSDEEIKMADFIFFRTFDVGKLTISDIIEDTIAGTDARFIFNKTKQKTTDILKSEVTVKDNNAKTVASNATQLLSKLDLQGINEGILNPGKHALDEPLSDENNIQRKKIKVDDGRDGKGSQAQSDDRAKLKPADDMYKTDSRPSKKVKVNDNSSKSEEVQHGVSRPTVTNNDKASEVPIRTSEDKSKSVTVSSLIGRDKGTSNKVKLDEKKTKLADEALQKTSAAAPDKDLKSNGQAVEVTRMPDVVTSKDKASEVPINSSEGKLKPTTISCSIGRDMGTSRKVKLDEKKTKLADESLRKTSAAAPDKDVKSQVVEVARRPDADRSKWFKGIPWEERMEDAHKQGTLVLLQNLDPSYTSPDVEDIIWHGFRETCTAKMVHRTMISSPYSGRALAIFKTKEAAEMVIRRLEQDCLMLPNGRPLVGSKGMPVVQGKQSQFCGHLFIDKVKLQMQREELKKAVSTSHCSQPNTIEYEMAMEWKLLQSKSDIWWKELYKQQGEELRKLKSGLKNK